MRLLKDFQINPLWLFGESFQQYVVINGRDVSPKVITIKEDNTETIVLVNQKAAAGYPHNIQDVDWYQTLPIFFSLYQNIEMLRIEAFRLKEIVCYLIFIPTIGF